MVGFARAEADRLFGIGRLRAGIGFRYDSPSLLSRRLGRGPNTTPGSPVH
jgi:hypothetical protein